MIPTEERQEEAKGPHHLYHNCWSCQQWPALSAAPAATAAAAVVAVAAVVVVVVVVVGVVVVVVVVETSCAIVKTYSGGSGCKHQRQGCLQLATSVHRLLDEDTMYVRQPLGTHYQHSQLAKKHYKR